MAVVSGLALYEIGGVVIPLVGDVIYNIRHRE